MTISKYYLDTSNIFDVKKGFRIKILTLFVAVPQNMCNINNKQTFVQKPRGGPFVRLKGV